MTSFLQLVYGLFAYVTFLSAFVYAIGFVGNVGVPKSIDHGAQVPLAESLMVNVLLLALFAVQHSVMARKGFKRLWTRVVPPALERSTFVLFASAALIFLYWQWRPITQAVWTTTNPTAVVLCMAVCAFGWLLVLISTFLLSLLRGAYQIKGIRILKTDGQVPVPFVSAREMDLSVEWAALLEGSIVAEIELYKPELNFVNAEDPDRKQTGIDSSWTDTVRELAASRAASSSVRAASAPRSEPADAWQFLPFPP